MKPRHIQISQANNVTRKLTLAELWYLLRFDFTNKHYLRVMPFTVFIMMVRASYEVASSSSKLLQHSSQCSCLFLSIPWGKWTLIKGLMAYFIHVCMVWTLCFDFKSFPINKDDCELWTNVNSSSKSIGAGVNWFLYFVMKCDIWAEWAEVGEPMWKERKHWQMGGKEQERLQSDMLLNTMPHKNNWWC